MFQIGDKHPNWKGDKAKYSAKHIWVGKHKPQPKCCEVCHKETKELDKHSISGNYTRDLDDWIYVCMPCHIELNKQNKENKKNNKCLNEHLTKGKIWRQNNPDKVKATQKNYNENHKEEKKLWNKNHKEELAEYHKTDKVKAKKKIYAENHKEERKEKDRKYYIKHRDRIRARKKLHRENNNRENNNLIYRIREKSSRIRKKLKSYLEDKQS